MASVGVQLPDSALTCRSLEIEWLGRLDYNAATALQEERRERVLADHSTEYLLLLEHSPTFTLGRNADHGDVKASPAWMKANGVVVAESDRGGDVTYHGPGQLVGYVLVDVPFGPGAVHAHVAAIEQVVLDALGDLGLDGASRRAGHPGVWVDDRKIAAVGVRITRGRSMHGLALNVDPDLTMFDHIVPCGIHDLGVTSLAAEGRPVPSRVVQDAIVARAAAQFGDGDVDDRVMRWDDVDAGVLQ